MGDVKTYHLDIYRNNEDETYTEYIVIQYIIESTNLGKNVVGIVIEYLKSWIYEEIITSMFEYSQRRLKIMEIPKLIVISEDILQIRVNISMRSSFDAVINGKNIFLTVDRNGSTIISREHIQFDSGNIYDIIMALIRNIHHGFYTGIDCKAYIKNFATPSIRNIVAIDITI